MENFSQLKVEIDLPVYNEELCLKTSIDQLISFLQFHNFKYEYKIVIVDNASTDQTPKIAQDLKNNYAVVDYLRVNKKGRGRALRQAWQASQADIVSYMDIDLSTNLTYFPRLIESIALENYDIATGSRMLATSKVQRSLKREIISRSYIFCLKYFLHVNFDDAQCGFKAMNRKVIDNLLPTVKDQAWFFDSELLFRCQKAKYRIKEIPIEWIEDKNSKVKIIPTALNYLISLIRLKIEFNHLIKQKMR